MQEALERWEVKSGKASKILDAKPELDTVELELWIAFKRLHHARQHGFGAPQPLQISEILNYAVYLQLDIEDTESLLYFIIQLDNKWLQWWQDNKSKDGKGK